MVDLWLMMATSWSRSLDRLKFLELIMCADTVASLLYPGFQLLGHVYTMIPLPFLFYETDVLSSYLALSGYLTAFGRITRLALRSRFSILFMTEIAFHYTSMACISIIRCSGLHKIK